MLLFQCVSITTCKKVSFCNYCAHVLIQAKEIGWNLEQYNKQACKQCKTKHLEQVHKKIKEEAQNKKIQAAKKEAAKKEAADAESKKKQEAAKKDKKDTPQKNKETVLKQVPETVQSLCNISE
jgi:hypothetical protein